MTSPRDCTIFTADTHVENVFLYLFGRGFDLLFDILDDKFIPLDL
jgi:hypothetical protein